MRQRPAYRKLLLCLTMAFAVLFIALSTVAQERDRARISERFPVQGTQSLSPPIVQSPIHDCARAVHVSGFIPGAFVRVYAGSSVIASAIPPFGFADIPLTREVHTSESITATQTVNSIESEHSISPVIVSAYPPLTTPKVVEPIYDCGRVVPAGNLVASTHVKVRDGSTVIGEGDATGDWLAVVTSPLVAGHLITAEQTACPSSPSPAHSISSPKPVQSDPSPIPPPVVDPVIVGNDAVTMHHLLPGAEVTVRDHATIIGGGFANADSNWVHIAPPITASSVITVVQKLCTPSGPSDVPPVRSELPPVQLVAPICIHAHQVTIRNTVLNANVVLKRNGTIIGYGGAVPGDLQLSIPSSVLLEKGDQIEAIQYIGSVISPPSNAVFVGCDRLDVVTQHNDSYRRGAYTSEPALTPTVVASRSFGLLYRRHVDGDVLAQPLYVHGVRLTARTANLFFIATAKNWLYAFDADDLNTDPATPPVWSVQLEASRKLGVCGIDPTCEICAETYNGYVGVTATPVIDTSRNLLYVVARRTTTGPDDGNNYLHAIDIRTGTDAIRPRLVEGSYNGVQFNKICERNRPALLLQNDVVYVGFGTFTCDQGCPNGEPYRGWVFGYRAADLTPAGSYCATVGDGQWGNGIWQSGNGLVGGDDGAIYLETGNGPTPNGDGFVKLVPTGGTLVPTILVPNNAPALLHGDTDLGSGGPMMLPGNRLIGGGKEGRFFVLNPSTMSFSQDDRTTTADGIDGWIAFTNTYHDNAGHPPCIHWSAIAGTPKIDCDSHPNTTPPSPIYDPRPGNGCYVPKNAYQCSELQGPNIHAGPVYWNGRIYHMPEKDYLRAFAYDTTTHHVTEAGTAAAGATIGGTFIDARPPDGMPGGFSSVSARKNLDGIVWTAFPLVDGQWNNGSGRIVAFDATTLRPIWYDDGDVNFAKFNAPTVANGKVIRATFSNMVVVYGLRKFTIGRPPWWFSLAARIDTLDQKVNELSNTLGTEVTPQNTEAKPRHRDFVARVVPTPNTVPLMASVHLPHPECARPQPKESTVEIDSSVYESPKYGAHLVRGDIRALWLKLGGPNSRLGFPITDERLTPDMKGRFSRFENGEIWWYPDRGAFVKKSGKQPG